MKQSYLKSWLEIIKPLNIIIWFKFYYVSIKNITCLLTSDIKVN